MAKQMNHAEYQAKVKRMTYAQLTYVVKDATRAIEAMPNGDNEGYYADEVNYCADEISRRDKLSKAKATPAKLPRKVLYEDNGTERIGLLVHIIEDAAMPYIVITRQKWPVAVKSVIERHEVEKEEE